ncbi:hypothetical protein ABEF95_002265 [Exophiala dermatitidis]
MPPPLQHCHYCGLEVIFNPFYKLQTSEHHSTITIVQHLFSALIPNLSLVTVVCHLHWLIGSDANHVYKFSNSIHKFYPLVKGSTRQWHQGDELRYVLAGGPWRVRIAYDASGPVAGAQRESFRWEYWDRTTLAWRFLVEATGPSQVERALWTLHGRPNQCPTQRDTWDRFEHLRGGRLPAAIPLNALRDQYVAARAGPPAAAAAVAAPVPAPAAAAAAPPAPPQQQHQQQPGQQQPADPAPPAPSGDDNAEDES